MKPLLLRRFIQFYILTINYTYFKIRLTHWIFMRMAKMIIFNLVIMTYVKIMPFLSIL